MELKICAGLSLFIFTVAAWIGFVDTKDPNQPENKLKVWLNTRIFAKRCRWAAKNPYALTKVGLVIGFVLGVTSILIA